jgi:hypothetical protein
VNTISNGLKECAKAVKYAYVIAVLNVNQQSNVREHDKHECVRAHEHGVFDITLNCNTPTNTRSIERNPD